QFDAFYDSPRYWIEEAAGRKSTRRTEGTVSYWGYEHYRLGFRDIARSTDSRTFISAMLPKRVFCNNKVPTIAFEASQINSVEQLYLCSLFNSFLIDYVVRQKVSATLNLFYLYQLPVPRLTSGHPFFNALVPRAARLTCTTHHFADLWQEVMGTPWPDDPLVCPPPRSGDPEIEALRQRLRDEIDALVAHLYGLSR